MIPVLEDERCISIRKKGLSDYVINGKTFSLLRYTTRARSPWRFTFDEGDIDHCDKMSLEHDRVVLGLICGGDGICSLPWSEARKLLGGNPGWIAVRRNHHESYGVSGSADELEGKIPVAGWPDSLFDSTQSVT